MPPVKSPWWLALIAAGLVVLMCLLTVHFARARDLGQWENGNPAIREWYRNLRRPDYPDGLCCDVADAWWADEINVRDGKTYATITDDRDDAPLRRPHVPNGTVFEIPNEKLKWDSGNPTGHGVLFLGVNRQVLCFVQSSGS